MSDHDHGYDHDHDHTRCLAMEPILNKHADDCDIAHLDRLEESERKALVRFEEGPRRTRALNSIHAMRVKVAKRLFHHGYEA
jgi:hypothetical protein